MSGSPSYEPADLEVPRGPGFEAIPGAELVTLTPEEYGVRVRSCLGPDRGPVYLSFDIDVLDPASAPGTGFDVVEVAPAYDSPGQITAVNAAAVAFDLLALPAVTRR